MIRETRPTFGPFRPLIECPGTGHVADALRRCPVCKVTVTASLVPTHMVDPATI